MGSVSQSASEEHSMFFASLLSRRHKIRCLYLRLCVVCGAVESLLSTTLKAEVWGLRVFFRWTQVMNSGICQKMANSCMKIQTASKCESLSLVHAFGLRCGLEQHGPLLCVLHCSPHSLETWMWAKMEPIERRHLSKLCLLPWKPPTVTSFFL